MDILPRAICNHAGIPKLDIVCNLCKLLNCDIDYLTGEIPVETRGYYNVMQRTGLSDEAVKYLELLKARLGKEKENGETVSVSGCNAALTGKESGEPDTIIRAGDMQSIFMVNIQERRDKTGILYGKTGYYLPEREDEVRRFCASMRHRVRQVWATAANVAKAAGLTRAVKSQLDGQLTIDGGGGDG